MRNVEFGPTGQITATRLTAWRATRGAATWMLVVAILLGAALIGAVPAQAEEPECASISARGVEKQMNLHASEVLVKCGVVAAGSSAGSESSVLGPDFPGSDVDVITGTETYPRVTQAESSVWSHGSTVVVNYNDARGDTESPVNLSGVSVSKNSGATFTRLGISSPFKGHGANSGDPILVYNEKLGKWFAGDLAAGECGGQGIGLWTSTEGETWTVGACAHVGSNDDRESMWVDNNAASPHYGRMYVSFNNFSVSEGALQVAHSDNGTTWSAPATVFSTFRRDVQLTGSPGSDGTVFVVGQNENGGKVGNTGQQNYMYRSTDGGETWTSSTMGPTFTIAGNTSCGYFPAIPPIWRETGWGQPAVGPNGVVQYVYAAHGTAPDESDIFYVRSTDNGVTWSTPLRLNTDSSGKAQWMPSLRVTPTGFVEASWYDRRNTTNGENYQRFARVSTNNGATWGPDEPLSTVMIPQPTQPDPKIQSCYAGDYNYTTANSNTGFDTWTDGRVSIEGKSVQKVFFHSIALQAGPTAITEAATGITKIGATLNGTVNPNGLETKYYFEYGKTTSYGTKTAEASAGSGTSNVKESKTITGLTANTIYHFRIVATNSKGTTDGSDLAFTTIINAPENTVLPVASPETPDQAVPESTTTGTWTNSPTGYAYQWERCNATGGECAAISGASSSTYTPVVADVGHTLVAKVTAKNSGGEGSAHSKATGKVQATGTITEYSLTSGSWPRGIASGPDGNLWFTDQNSSKIGKMTTSGTATEYSVPSGSEPVSITAGPDGDLWFTDAASAKIGKITTSGTIIEYALPGGSYPTYIATGSDHNLWFTAGGTAKVGKITTSGSITEYSLPAESEPFGITAGPDGNLWFTERLLNRIGKITTSGTITEYSLPTGSFPWEITAGPDGNLWFTDVLSNKIGKITTSGSITEYSLPAESEPFGITAGPDGNLWFTDYSSSKIGRITTSGTITEYSLPTNSRPEGITAGSDDNLWFTDAVSSKIGKITP
jgi:virginiamycin B lyase